MSAIVSVKPARAITACAGSGADEGVDSSSAIVAGQARCAAISSLRVIANSHARKSPSGLRVGSPRQALMNARWTISAVSSAPPRAVQYRSSGARYRSTSAAKARSSPSAAKAARRASGIRSCRLWPDRGVKSTIFRVPAHKVAYVSIS
jgi:hypothetical protein